MASNLFSVCSDTCWFFFSVQSWPPSLSRGRRWIRFQLHHLNYLKFAPFQPLSHFSLLGMFKGNFYKLQSKWTLNLLSLFPALLPTSFFASHFWSASFASSSLIPYWFSMSVFYTIVNHHSSCSSHWKVSPLLSFCIFWHLKEGCCRAAQPIGQIQPVEPWHLASEAGLEIWWWGSGGTINFLFLAAKFPDL